MTLSNRGDYVVRSAMSLAQAFDGGSALKLRELVADTEIPATFASQILGDLVRAGLVLSRAGREGGYRLSRSPDTISLLEVVEAAEGPLHAEHCALGKGPCRWDAVCPMHDTWIAATAAMRDTLAATSLDHLAERDLAIAAGTYEAPADSHRAAQRPAGSTRTLKKPSNRKPTARPGGRGRP
ncbi:MAG: RrF2 family transcriptional regulator [Acidimicrobiales bacterium]|jgi:Rrf2 family protein